MPLPHPEFHQECVEINGILGLLRWGSLRHRVGQHPTGDGIKATDLDAVALAEFRDRLPIHARVWPHGDRCRQPQHFHPLRANPASVEEHTPAAGDLRVDRRVTVVCAVV